MKKLILTAMILVLSIGVSFAGVSNEATSGSQAGASALIENNDNSNTNITDRSFVQPGFAPAAETKPFFTEPTKDSSFRSVTELVKFGNMFSEAVLKKMARGVDSELNFDKVRDFDKPDNRLEDGQRYILIVHEGTMPPGYKNSSTFQNEAKDADTTSFQIVAEAALAAIENGDNILFIYSEDWHRKVEADGWGIGSYAVAGAVADSGKVSGVGGGGFGIASNETGPEDRPWIHGYSGCVPYVLSITPEVNSIKVEKYNYDNIGEK